ncbi:PhoH-like protein [Pirellulimonas nuda]|uniref:PhoH-like protein n=1 Tax=Pirellulimonas nuda TaxID=2528009 RepID=A0A518D6C6_9BACT|nr:PhoH family protein [Pirellulimonas nuda]QDU87026.1 PhoH-like protein [Pirellulimonas nuda]
MIEASIPVGDPDHIIQLFGTADQHLKRIREAIPAKISARGGRIHLSGDDAAVRQATGVFETLKNELAHAGQVGADAVRAAIDSAVGGESARPPQPIGVQKPGVTIRPRTPGQAKYVDAIRAHDMVFCVGPAGCGKTYLAVAAAIEALREQRVRKIVLVRPAVEAGENLGFLPGDLQAKINPYLRPLLDALGEMLDADQLKRYMAEDVIEVAPLAYMRGRTLNGAFIIMDEGQNTTVSQMKMFLTRMGADSKVVISGDTSQIDLPPHTRSGLIDALVRLSDIPGIASTQLTTADIVRHPLVQAIVDAYEEPMEHR